MPKRSTAVDLRAQHQQIVELVELNDSRTRSFQQLERYFQNLTILAPLSPDAYDGMVAKEAGPSLPKGLFPGSVTPNIALNTSTTHGQKGPVSRPAPMPAARHPSLLSAALVEFWHDHVRTLLSKINTVRDEMVLTGRLSVRLNEHYDITNCYTYARDHLDEALGIGDIHTRPLPESNLLEYQQHLPQHVQQPREARQQHELLTHDQQILGRTSSMTDLSGALQSFEQAPRHSIRQFQPRKRRARASNTFTGDVQTRRRKIDPKEIEGRHSVDASAQGSSHRLSQAAPSAASSQHNFVHCSYQDEAADDHNSSAMDTESLSVVSPNPEQNLERPRLSVSERPTNRRSNVKKRKDDQSSQEISAGDGGSMDALETLPAWDFSFLCSEHKDEEPHNCTAPFFDNAVLDDSFDLWLASYDEITIGREITDTPNSGSVTKNDDFAAQTIVTDKNGVWRSSTVAASCSSYIRVSCNIT